MMRLKPPYLLFLGDTKEPGHAKTAFGLAEWAREACLGQMRLSDDAVDVGLPEQTIAEAANAGVRSFVVGVAQVGGALEEHWRDAILEAIDAGLDIVSGMHERLADDEAFRDAADRRGVHLVDVRTPPTGLPIANGVKRRGKRLLTVGTDCAVGKKYTSLAIAEAMQRAGIKATFRATGQTGIMIAGSGIPIDAVVSDFIAGAAEILSPDNEPDHWDVIEGQGSLFHPAYAGVSLGLLHGSQPDAIVICHDPSREHILGFPGFPVPDIARCIERNLELARLTNPNVRCVGVSVNTGGLTDFERAQVLGPIAEQMHLPVTDPIALSAGSIIDFLLQGEH